MCKQRDDVMQMAGCHRRLMGSPGDSTGADVRELSVSTPLCEAPPQCNCFECCDTLPWNVLKHVLKHVETSEINWNHPLVWQHLTTVLSPPADSAPFEDLWRCFQWLQVSPFASVSHFMSFLQRKKVPTARVQTSPIHLCFTFINLGPTTWQRSTKIHKAKDNRQ